MKKEDPQLAKIPFGGKRLLLVEISGNVYQLY
jgi:hypothetical protein